MNFDQLDCNSSEISSAIPPNFEDNVSLILAGRGAKGAAQAGAIKAINEYFQLINNQINVGAKIDYVVGSSIGAFNSMFVAANKIAELEYFWRKVHRLKAINLVKELKKRISYKDFDPRRTLYEVSKVNLQNGMVEYANWQSEDIFEDVRQSMRIPVIMNAIMSNGSQYVDGGVIANLPISRCLSHKGNKYWIIVLGLEKHNISKNYYWWPIGQGARVVDIQGRELQRYQRLLLIYTSTIRKLVDFTKHHNLSLDEIEFIKSIEAISLPVNRIIIPLEDCITTSTIWFSRKKCNHDFDKAYESTFNYLDSIMRPLVDNFITMYSQTKN